MVRPSHAQLLFDEYKGTHKQIIIFEGTHHSDRPKEVLRRVYAFIEEALNLESLPLDSKKQSRKEDSELADVRSFSVLKEEKVEKLTDQRMSLKL